MLIPDGTGYVKDGMYQAILDEIEIAISGAPKTRTGENFKIDAKEKTPIGNALERLRNANEELGAILRNDLLQIGC
jgi:hypothetical protein